MCIRILLADDHEIVREGVKDVLQRHADYAVIAEARTGHEAIRLATQFTPDIVLMDMYMPLLNGIDATAHLRDARCKSKVIGLSGCGDQRAISRMLAAGAHAYVAKSWPSRELIRAINTVHANQPYHGPASLAIPLALDQPAIPNAGKLSDRERQTLQLIAAGKSSKDIAEELCVCIKTVEAHRHSLRIKLGRSTVADLTRYAIEEGLAGAGI